MLIAEHRLQYHRQQEHEDPQPVGLQRLGQPFDGQTEQRIVTHVPHVRSQPPGQEEDRCEDDAEHRRIQEIDGMRLCVLEVIGTQALPEHTGGVLIVEIVRITSPDHLQGCGYQDDDES